jgi:hypothetical protein
MVAKSIFKSQAMLPEHACDNAVILKTAGWLD